MKQIMIIGNIGREPEVKTRTNGKDYMIFSVAVSTPNGAEWYGICAPRFDKIMPWLTKGRTVFVQGTPQFSVYRDSVDITIFADNVQLCGGSKDGAPVDKLADEPSAASATFSTMPQLPTLP